MSAVTKRVALYVRVSTNQQTTENQLLVLQEVAARLGWTIVQVFADEGISGAKGRNKRPGLDGLMKAVARREIDLVAAWSVDRLGRSLSHLVTFLGDLQARGVDLYLHQQALDTSTPSGRMLFQMLGVFAEFERAIITSRIRAGIERSRAKGTRFGRPPTAVRKLDAVRSGLAAGQSIRVIAKAARVSTATVIRVKRATANEAQPESPTMSG